MILTLSLGGAIAGLASPLFQKVYIDGLLGDHHLALLGLGLDRVLALQPIAAISCAFVCTLLAQAFGLVANYLSMYEGAVFQRVLSEALYRKMLSIRPTSMGTTTVGEVVSIYATDVAGSSAIIDQVLPMVFLMIFHFLFAPVAVYVVCGIPMWATGAAMVSVITLNMIFGTRQSRFFTRYKQLAAERTGVVNEWVQTIRLLRILGWVERFEGKILAKRREETDNRIAMVSNGQLMNSFGTSINFMLNLIAVASLIFLSGRKASPSDLLTLLWIFGVFLARSFRQIPWLFVFTLDSLTSMRRLQTFLARTSDAGPVDLTQASFAGVKDGERASPAALSIAGLNLKIGGNEILKDVSLEVAPGELAAVVGEVGSGKTMLVLSLVGETGATFERFRVGETDALPLELDERRRFFAFVPQEGFVMSASLRENIVFHYEPGFEQDGDVENSLAVAQFPVREIQGNGLDTEIGERGVNLSGGQRQRVSLARAHHFDRPVILLDDCLSAVDVDTERLLLRDLIEGVWRGHTRLLVTHRLSVLTEVDKIFFMEGGRIIDSGTYEELMKRSGRMQEFVASVQRGEQDADSVQPAGGAAEGGEGQKQEAGGRDRVSAETVS